MNAREAFPGTGMQQTGFAASQDAQRVEARNDAFGYGVNEPDPDALMSEALAEDLGKETPPTTVAPNFPTATGTDKDRGIFERSIAARKLEKAKQQEIARAALAKAKQLTASIHAMEAALDGLAISEVA